MVVVEQGNCRAVTGTSPEALFFSTLKLLQFNIAAAEKQYKMPFREDMFRVPNKKGLEAVLHFLLQKLDPERSKSDFAGCWPTYDVKRSHQFRKIVFNWLTELNRDYAQGVQVPRINSSTLTKASGQQVVDLLERLSALVLAHAISSRHRDRAKVSPVFTPSKPHLNTAAAEALHLELETLRRQLAARAHQTLGLRGQWTESAKTTAEQIQGLGRKKKLLEQKKRTLEERQKSCLSSSGGGEDTGAKLIRTLSIAEEDSLRAEVQANATQLKQQLRRVLEVHKRRAAERAVLNSLMGGGYGEHTIHHDQIALQVPSILISEYQAQLGEGRVGNTYLAGHLSLLSLTKIALLGLKMLLKSVDENGEAARHTPTPVLTAVRCRLVDELHSLEQSGRWVAELEAAAGELRAELWAGQPTEQDLRLQSPMPVFSLKSSAAAGKVLRVSVMTPVPQKSKAVRRSVSTPLSMRKFRKRQSSRMSNLSSCNPVEETPAQEVSRNLSQLFETTDQPAAGTPLASFLKRENTGELNDLSLLDASTNLSFFN